MEIVQPISPLDKSSGEVLTFEPVGCVADEDNHKLFRTPVRMPSPVQPQKRRCATHPCSSSLGIWLSVLDLLPKGASTFSG
jgi:hypothetical protein